MTHVDIGAFLDSWSDELAAQAKRVRQLIGDAHWLSDGNHKEAVLRSFLRKYVPTMYSVLTGFAVNPESQLRLTRQQDVLICDLANHSPLLIEDSFAIVPSACVAGYIEVKSSLTSSDLQDALGAVSQSSAVLSGQLHTPWRAIFFFSNHSSSNLQFKGWVENALSSIPAYQLNPAYGPLCVVAVGAFVAFLTIEDSRRGRLRVFPTGDKSLAFGILDLISTLRSRVGADSGAQIESLTTPAGGQSPSIFDINLEVF